MKKNYFWHMTGSIAALWVLTGSVCMADVFDNDRDGYDRDNSGRSNLDEDVSNRSAYGNNVFGLSPQVGMIGFNDAFGNYQSRGVVGMGAERTIKSPLHHRPRSFLNKETKQGASNSHS